MKLQLELVIPAVAAFFGLVSLFAAIYSVRKYRNQLLLIEINSEKMEALEKKLTLQTLLLEETQNLVTEQTRRITRLESNVLPSQKATENKDEKALAAKPLKSNMVERRQQVLTLARRGEDVDTISSTLGMLRGEVELIVNLNQGSANYA